MPVCGASLLSRGDVWPTRTWLLGALKCLVHTAAKTASGPTSNSFAFNSNQIRPLNGFSAQPFSAFTATPYLCLFPLVLYLSNYCFPFCLFLSSLSLSLFLTATMLCPTSHFLSSSASSPLHLARFVFLSHPVFHAPALRAPGFHSFSSFLTVATNFGLSLICWSEYRLLIPITFLRSPHQKEQQMYITWMSGDGLSLSLQPLRMARTQGARAWQALLGVSQASVISNYTVWQNFEALNGVSRLVQSDFRTKLPSQPQSQSD